jgi:uncharacterized protein (TIGR01777 family)
MSKKLKDSKKTAKNLSNRVIITGATGFIGRALVSRLCRDFQVVALSRDAKKAARLLEKNVTIREWDARTTSAWQSFADGALAIINLAGENIASGRWNKFKKNSILHSRIDASRAVLDAVKQAANKPDVVIQASAIGYYGSRGDEELDEKSSPGTGFLADVCRKCEAFADRIEKAGVRTVIIRTGLVLGPNGGALVKFVKPFRFHLGGYIGTGKKWLSWISLEDQLQAIKFLMQNQNLSGPFNLTAPQPVTAKQFALSLAKILKTPAWLRAPAFVARMAIGQAARETLLASQKVVPKRLLDTGFEFKHPDIQSAITACGLKEEK